MTIDRARRIVSFVDDRHMSDERLARQLGCSVTEARYEYATAKSIVRNADARNAVNELKRMAGVFNVTAYELVAMFA